MERELVKPTVTVQPINETFQTFISRPYINTESRERLSKANALMIPSEGYGERNDLIYFPVGTTELFQFFGEKKVENLTVDICIEEKDYKEVALHADWLTLAGFVVTSLVAPLVVNLLTEYIKHRLGKRESETIVRSKIIVFDEQNGRYVSYSYEGPAPEYHHAMMNAIAKLKNPDVPLLPAKAKRKHHAHRKH